MTRALRGVKLLEKKSSPEPMDLLSLEETSDRLATVNRVYGMGMF